MSDAKNYPAFPVSIGSHDGHQDSALTWQYPGISIRDYFAGKALQGLISGALADGSTLSDNSVILFSERAYEFSDAMLAEREK